MQTNTTASPSHHLRIPLGQIRVTYVLLAINVLVFAAMTVAGGSTNTSVLVRFGAKVNVLIAQGEVWRLLTSMFLHIGLMHLAFNGYALFVLGTEVERLYGSTRFLAIYLLAGAWGSLISFTFGPSLSAGASGAIFGLLGVMVAFFRRHRKALGEWGHQRLVSLLGVAGFNLVLGFTVPGIDNLAHLGGLISGLILGWILAPDYQVEWDADVGPKLVDRVGLLNRWWVILLAVALLVGGTSATISVQSQSAPVLIHQGQQALDKGETATAEALFRQATVRNPQSALAFFYLGVTLSDQGRTGEAIEAYQATISLEPNLAEAYWNLALAYADLGHSQEAIASLETFIGLRPDSADAQQAQRIIDSLKSPSQ